MIKLYLYIVLTLLLFVCPHALCVSLPAKELNVDKKKQKTVEKNKNFTYITDENVKASQASAPTTGGTVGAPYVVPTDGNNVLYINSGAVYQDAVTNIAAGYVYTLRVDVGGRVNTNANYTVRLIKIDPSIGETVVAEETGTKYSPDPTPLDLPVILQWSSSFADTGSVLRIELGMNGNLQALFDNVQLDVIPLPEPTALVLISLGGVTFFNCRR